jgi:hypothetical protein
MALTQRSEGAMVDWVNRFGVPRRKGDIVVDGLLIGVAMDHIAPVGEEVWKANEKPILSSGCIRRCGYFTYNMHLQKAVEAWQAAFYNETIDKVTDTPGSFATMPRAASGNVGSAQVSSVSVSDTMTAEAWILECLGVSGGYGKIWRVAGSMSGTLSDVVPTGQWWSDTNNTIGFKITEGDTPAVAGDRFTWYTTEARTRIGIFMSSYPASVTSGMILLDSKIPYKTRIYGKYYR